jgi:hypothetical protein
MKALPILTVFASCLALSAPAMARPVSFPGGWMVMQDNDFSQNDLSVSYSPTASDAFGVESDYFRDDNQWLHTVTYNRLLNRWNSAHSQANIFFESGIGVGEDHGYEAPAGFAGIEADWESRRYYASYSNRYIASSAIDQDFSQKARIGFAPYLSPYDGVHPWLMLQVDNNPNYQDKFVVTPLIRLFNTGVLTELGYSSSKTLLANVTLQF